MICRFCGQNITMLPNTEGNNPFFPYHTDPDPLLPEKIRCPGSYYSVVEIAHLRARLKERLREEAL